jgi:DNA-directed RNA polymerase specialized sigma subunit
MPDDDVALSPREIINMFRQGKTFREIGEYAGVSAEHVSEIVNAEIQLLHRLSKRLRTKKSPA